MVAPRKTSDSMQSRSAEFKSEPDDILSKSYADALTSDPLLGLGSEAGQGSMSGVGTAPAGNPPSQEYLEQLMRDKQQLRNAEPFQFLHVNKLIDKEISRVVSVMSTQASSAEKTAVEGESGEKVCLSETIMVPVDKYPKYNFVGRILGPRGMTAKQLEEDTGCKIMVRGRGSSRMYQNGRRERTAEDEPLHVLIQCEDFDGRCQTKMRHAIEAINQLLHPPPEGKDELKRKQLIELSIINGTYRATPATKVALQTPRPSSHLPSSMESMQYSDPARLLSTLTESSSSNNKKVPCPFKNDSVDDQTTQMAQLLAMLSLNPLQQAAINPLFAADYYKNLLSYSMSDPSMMSSLLGQGMDSMGSPVVSHGLPLPGAIPQANLQQYLQAAAMLNSVPFVHDGSGDKSKR